MSPGMHADTTASVPSKAQHAASEDLSYDETCGSVPSDSTPVDAIVALSAAAGVPAGGKTARMIASLAICVFSGLIFWVFKRRRARKKGKLHKKKKHTTTTAAAQTLASTQTSNPASPQRTPPQRTPTSPQSTTSPRNAPLPAQQPSSSTPPRTPPSPAKGSKGSPSKGTSGKLALPQSKSPVDLADQEASGSSLALTKKGQQEKEGASGSSSSGAEGELRAALQKATRDLQRTRAALEESAKRGQAATAAAEQLTEELRQATHEVAQLQAGLEQARAGHQQAEREAAEARKRESALGAEVQDLRTDVTKLRNQVATTSGLQTSNVTLTQRVRELEGQVEALAVGRSRDSQEAGRRLAEAQQALEAALSARAVAEADRDKIKERSSEALRKVGSIQSDMARISSQMEALRGERDELRGVVQGEAQARRNLEAALSTERQRCRALEVQHRAAQEAIRTMEARLRVLERRSGEFTAQQRQHGH